MHTHFCAYRSMQHIRVGNRKKKRLSTKHEQYFAFFSFFFIYRWEKKSNKLYANRRLILWLVYILYFFSILFRFSLRWIVSNWKYEIWASIIFCCFEFIFEHSNLSEQDVYSRFLGNQSTDTHSHHTNLSP